jgi:hypothetical protein
MSFIIAVHVGEGIIMASDSRTTYTSTEESNGQIIYNIGVHATNSTEKTFLCPNNCGISTCGDASTESKPITGYIQSFIRENIIESTDVTQVPQKLLDYFKKFDPIPDTNFIVAGYQKSDTGLCQKIYKVFIILDKIEEIDNNFQGATWNGECDTLIRLTQPVSVLNQDGTYTNIETHEILFNYFTLQDAVDFAQYAVETTINTMHFQNVVETVGGDIDILVIKPEKSFWLAKKELKIN